MGPLVIGASPIWDYVPRFQTKLKANSTPHDIYTLHCRLINVDIYSFDFKLNHIAKHLRLPQAATMGPAAQQLPPSERLPPIVLINLQLPTYPVSTKLSKLNKGNLLVPT